MVYSSSDKKSSVANVQKVGVHILLLLLICACGARVNAQTSDEADIGSDGQNVDTSISTTDVRKNAILFLVPGPLFGHYYFEYQRALSERHSINLSAEYVNFEYKGDELARFWFIYRYKLIENTRGPLDGFTLAPALQTAIPFDGSTFIINTFVYLSYQHIFDFGLALQVFAGAGYGIATTEVEKYNMFYGFNPSYGLSVGYAF